MKKSLLASPALPLIFAVLPLTAVMAGVARAEPVPASVTINFEVGEPRGAVMVALFDSEEAYAKGGKPAAATHVDASAGPVAAAFPDLKPGRYAAKAFQDLNGDGKLSTNPMGQPTEPFGFSNNAQPRFGPAPWSEAAFEVTTGAHQHRITLR